MINPTSFSELIGNDLIKSYLNQLVLKKTIGHAYLFAGPEGVGKSLFALAFAASIMKEYNIGKDPLSKIAANSHPDIHTLKPEGKLGLHSMQTLRQLSEEVHLPPFESAWKFFIIHDADRMLPSSANALLKTFEEPPPRTVILLLTRNEAALLPTILSRCCPLRFKGIEAALIKKFLIEKYALGESASTRIAFQSGGSIAKAITLATYGNDMREAVLNLMTECPYIDYKLFQAKIQNICQMVDASKKKAEEKMKEESVCHTAVDKQALEKEIEGGGSMTSAKEAEAIFEHIFSWHRDMLLLLLDPLSSHVINGDYKKHIVQAIQKGSFKSLEYVSKRIQEAQISLQRSTSLELCLENLLLKLDGIQSY